MPNSKGGAARMPERRSGKLIALLFVQAALCLVALPAAHAQSLSFWQGDPSNRGSTEELWQPLNPGAHASAPDSTTTKSIVIGFVGGFAKRDDVKHPEVQFAANLRERYPSQVYAEVFSNHEGQKALRQVLRL